MHIAAAKHDAPPTAHPPSPSTPAPEGLRIPASISIAQYTIARSVQQIGRGTGLIYYVCRVLAILSIVPTVGGSVRGEGQRAGEFGPDRNADE
jgi:hypothetical protein